MFTVTVATNNPSTDATWCAVLHQCQRHQQRSISSIIIIIISVVDIIRLPPILLEVLRERRPPPNARIQWIRISDFGLLDPDGDPDRYQNVITWSLGQNPRRHLFCVCWQRGSSSQIRIVIGNGLPDPDSEANRHQNVISWSLGHTPALHKISSKSVGNFFDNPVNVDFGLRTPGSERWSGSSPKLNPSFLRPCSTPPRYFVKIRSQLFQLSDGQTDRQTDGTKNITSFGGGN